MKRQRRRNGYRRPRICAEAEHVVGAGCACRNNVHLFLYIGLVGGMYALPRALEKSIMPNEI